MFRYIITMLMLLGVSSSVFAATSTYDRFVGNHAKFKNVSSVSGQFSGTVYAADAVFKGPSIDSRAYSTLALADAAATSAGKQLVISTVYTTVPATLSAPAVKILPGGKLNGSGTVAITGAFEGSDGCFGASQVVTGLKEARPDWWAVNAIPGTTDMTVALNRAATALSVGGELLLSSTYGVSASTKLYDHTAVVGFGNATVRIIDGAVGSINIFQNSNYTAYGGKGNPTVPDYSAKTPNYDISLRDLTLDCNKAGAPGATSNGFVFTLMDRVTIKNVTAVNATQKGGYIQSSKNVSVTHNSFFNNNLNGFHGSDNTDFDVSYNTANGNADYAFEVGAGDTTSAANATIGMPTTYGGDGSVNDNTVLGGVSVGIYLRGFNSRYIQDVRVLRNTVKNMTEGNIGTDPSTGSGIATSDYTKKLDISDNKLHDNANAGLYIFAGTGESNYTINNNTARANTHGMILNGLTYSFVTGNKLISNTSIGMKLNYLYASNVSRNDFYGNGTVTVGSSMPVTNTQLSYILANTFKSESHTANIDEGAGNASTNAYIGNVGDKGHDIISGSIAANRSNLLAPTFGTNYSGSNVKYYMDDGGVVHLQGVITKTVAGVAYETMLTLPVPYRPSIAMTFIASNADAPVPVKLNTTGILEFRTGNATTGIDLSGISFRP